MLDKTMAKKIYELAENDMSKLGQISYQTILLMKEAIDKIGKDYTDYLYTEESGTKMMFNLKRWKRRFLEDNKM